MKKKGLAVLIAAVTLGTTVGSTALYYGKDEARLQLSGGQSIEDVLGQGDEADSGSEEVQEKAEDTETVISAETADLSESGSMAEQMAAELPTGIVQRADLTGMTKEEAESNLGVIAKSGSYTFKNGLGDDKAEDLSIIGQFGVGFYSAFMVSDEVTVITRHYGEETATKWQSSGADGYTVSEDSREAAGTDVIMHLKPDTEDEEYSSYLEVWKIKSLIKKYSDYVRWPIKMDVSRQERFETEEKNDDGSPKYEYRTVTENETVNSMIPIWQRSKNDVSDEDCVNFYKEKFHAQKDPCALVRINAEGAVSYKAMLFVPGENDDLYFLREDKEGITLYSNGVMIMEKCDKLVHDYFEFVKGIVDSPDLSLNISREILQHDRQLKIIGKNIEKRVKDELEKLMREDRPI